MSYQTMKSAKEALHQTLLLYVADADLDRAALRGVLELHAPVSRVGHWVTCNECGDQAGPPPRGGIWPGTEYPCRTAMAVADALGVG